MGALVLGLADCRWRDRTSRLLVIYDGACRLCQWQADWLRRLVDARRVELVPYQTPGILARHPDLDEAAARASLQVVTASGDRLDGARAVLAVLRTVPLLAPLTLAYHLPGVPRLAEAGYALVARNRFHILGRIALAPCDETCRRPTDPLSVVPDP
jgi:predicted DCC family thiol-disulfide oxidoreductase YuxK